MDETRKTHESMVKAIQSKDSENAYGKEMADKQLSDLKEAHMKEVRDLEGEFNAIRKRLTGQVDQLTERNSELELALKLQVGDLEKEVAKLKEDLQASEGARLRAVEQSKSLDTQKLRMLEEAETRHKQMIVELEAELEEREARGQKEMTDQQQKSEESLAQLKNFYEQEKERLERRLLEDKERAQKRYNLLQEEYEQRIRDEQ